MAKITLSYDILNDTPASAVPVETNFNRIQDHINQEVIERGGTVAMTGQLRLAGNPIADLDAAPKQYVDGFMPLGSIVMYTGAVAPPLWKICDGAELEISAYAALHAVIGTSYGGSPGRFNLPNLQQRFPIGGTTLGATGGSAEGVVVAHTHDINHAHPAGTTGPTGTDHTHVAPDHLHGVNIWTSYFDTNHQHDFTVRQNPTAGGSTGEPFVSNATGTNSTRRTGYAATGEVNHRHAVNGVSDAADRVLTTTGHSANHTHPFTAATFEGPSGPASNSVAPGTANLPPYLVVNFIIKAQ